MSYLIQYAVGRAPAVTRARGTRVDERTLLNLPEFDGGAHVRVLVEDTSTRRIRRRRLPTPRLKLRIADCVNEVNLEFSVESADARENSLHKIDCSSLRSSASAPVSSPRRTSASCASAAHIDQRTEVFDSSPVLLSDVTARLMIADVCTS